MPTLPAKASSWWTPEAAVWWAFTPPLLSVGVGWVLSWLQERTDRPAAWRLLPFEGAQDPLLWLRPLGWGLLTAFVLLALGRIMMGRRATLRTLTIAWVLLHLTGCALQVARHIDLHHLQAQSPVHAEVLGSRTKPTTLRAAGGTLLVLRLQGRDDIQQLLTDHPDAPHWHAGQRLRLHWATGRFVGHYVTHMEPD